MERVNEAIEAHQGHLPDGDEIEGIVAEVVCEFRALWQCREQIPDDTIPIIGVHFDIGIQTAVMTGMSPSFLMGRWWLEPNLDWRAIDQLAFDPQNGWFQMFLALNRSLAALARELLFPALLASVPAGRSQRHPRHGAV